MTKFDFGDWARNNAFAIINLMVLIAGFAYAYGKLNTQVSQAETRLTMIEKTVDEMTRVGHPDHERRITSLESHSDQIQKLINVSEAQGKSISDLGAIVSKDHDLLLHFAAMSETSKK